MSVRAEPRVALQTTIASPSRRRTPVQPRPAGRGLQSILSQQAQLFESGLSMISEDVMEQERGQANRVLVGFKACWKAAHDAAEARSSPSTSAPSSAPQTRS